ncbi:MAG TPA: hypothetical protein VLN58_07830 [Verrucomicrobiae bacterium]|nr:hypothetical protein [Verrucomicrobiae bacterium]
MFRQAFKPGSCVPKDGMYWVYHYQHRISHLSYMKAGESFPSCVKCGERVRFEAAPEHQAADHISHDVDFRGEPADSSGLEEVV